GPPGRGGGGGPDRSDRGFFEEGFDDVPGLVDAPAGFIGAALVEGEGGAAALHEVPGEEEGGPAGEGAALEAGGGVVDGDEDAEVVEASDAVEQGAEEALVDALQGVDLGLVVAGETGLVGRFNVDGGEIVVVEGGEGGACLGGVV